MFYVKTTLDGALEQYPYTLADLRLAHPNTSWPKAISDELAAEFGVIPVTPAEQPSANYQFNLERTAVKQGAEWLEQWIETPATPEQIAERTAAKANEVRTERNERLFGSDWTQLADNTADTNAWAAYRQALRDLPSTDGFPHDVTWPTEPTT